MRCCAFFLFLLVLAAAAAAATPAALSLPRERHPSQGQLFYFVLTDRFANGDPTNDRGGLTGTREEHGFDPTALGYFHGGDLAGLTAHLPYLSELGVTSLWLTPPFHNKPVQSGSAGYHGYWILDFTRIDPHLGTNDEFRAFVSAAHARGLKVYMDIIVNHTADVITTASGDTTYRDTLGWPYRDADGQPFDAAAYAFNGLGGVTPPFPPLAVPASFAHPPVVSAGEANAKHPAWLNDLTLYHNRGNSRFTAEDALHGDFVGLDDLFTEHPRVVQGFIDLYREWMDVGVDGFRIDTAKHVNAEFWHAFAPALRQHALALDRPDFFAFGEVYSERGDPAFLSQFSTHAALDAPLDFGFFVAARNYVSRRGSAAALRAFFAADDYYTDHDSNVDAVPTFLGNHDAGRFAWFLQQDNPSASASELLDLMALGHGLLLLSRGQPVLYYGDEQGMIGLGHDMGARESMFGTQVEAFRRLPLVGTTRTSGDDKFDLQHPLYRLVARLAELRRGHPALTHGLMYPRAGDGHPQLFAFSRLERNQQIEYVVALNGAAREAARSRVPTSQPAGTRLQLLFHSRGETDGPADLRVAADGTVEITLAARQFAVWRAEQPLPRVAPTPTVRWLGLQTGDRLAFHWEPAQDGNVFPSRQELAVEVSGGDGMAEVTFLMSRSSRPGQYEVLGTDDAPPYRVFWRPSADLAPGEPIAFHATVHNLRGERATATVGDLRVHAPGVQFGIAGSRVPTLTAPPMVTGPTWSFAVEGTEPMSYQWWRDDQPIAGATAERLEWPAPPPDGVYRVVVRNVAGTTLSEAWVVDPTTSSTSVAP